MSTLTPPIRVIVIDDSVVVRQVLSSSIALDQQIEVVGVATDPFDARDKIVNLKPDVVTLDIEMPRMDGLTFLRKLMKFYPLPVIVVSSISQKSSDTAHKAMSYGAVDVVGKPASSQQLKQLAIELQEKIKVAASAKLPKYLVTPPKTAAAPPRLTTPTSKPKLAANQSTDVLVAIGSSTGGTQALRHLLAELPEDFPPVLMVQHMPLAFTESFAHSLDRITAMQVVHATDGEILATGKAILAPGDRHMMLHPVGRNFKVKLKDGPCVNRHKPSVDVLFKSVAQHAATKTIGVILTGMGDDGARGLLAMHNAGSRTLGQSESSCVVYGMPREAYEMGAVQTQLPLDQIARRLIAWVNQPAKCSA